MNLILLSKHMILPAQQKLNELTGKANSKIKLAFCTNASDAYGADVKQYVIDSRNELVELQYELVDLDLNSNLSDILEILKGVDATFFTGGSYYKLMGMLNKSGLSKTYKELLEKGLIHMGFSAGSMICGPDF